MVGVRSKSAELNAALGKAKYRLRSLLIRTGGDSNSLFSLVLRIVTTDIKKVALYTRVSTDEQKTDLQLMDLKDYIRKRGYTIYNTYEDVISGATKERKALDLLMSDAKRKCDIVLVWKFDRFARSLKMLVDSLALFQELSIDFIPTGKMLTPQQVWVDSYFI